MARPKGSKNKPKQPPSLLETKKALVDSEREFIVGLHSFLLEPPDNWRPPTNNFEMVIQNTVKRASDPEDKTSHQYVKLILERLVPQRKQVEHLGDLDAKAMGVVINVATQESKDGNEREPIEHEPIGREQPDGGSDIGGRDEKQPVTLVLSREDGGQTGG